MGGQDKQGFGMKQGVLVPGRVALLMTPGDSCFRGFGRRKGERRRKSVRGCIVSQDLSVLNLVIVKKGAGGQGRCVTFRRWKVCGRMCRHSGARMHAGEAEIPGLTDEEKPRIRGPKRASKIRKLFNLTKDDDVRKYVNTYRKVTEKDGKKHSKAPKIQRLVTPLTLQRKRHRRAIKRERISSVRSWWLHAGGKTHTCCFSHNQLVSVRAWWCAEQGRGRRIPQAAGHAAEGAARAAVRVPGQEACHQAGLAGLARALAGLQGVERQCCGLLPCMCASTCLMGNAGVRVNYIAAGLTS